MILLEATINGTLCRVSDENQSLEHFWENLVIRFDPPQYQLPTNYGGWCKLGFGSVEFSPGLFSAAWPPPVEISVTAKYTAADEAAAATLFTGVGYRSSYTRESVVYQLYPDAYSVRLLVDGVDYDARQVSLPRAFGRVTHVTPIRLADVAGKPTYHKGYIASTTPGTDWDVYDDGVSINANVTDNGDGTFSLSATPVGEVTMSGLAAETDLQETFSWACNSARLNLTLNHTYDRDPSPEINYWATSQMLLTDFLSNVAAYFTHLYYIAGSTLNLVDMKKDNGSRSVGEFGYFPGRYLNDAPISILRSTWQTRAAVEETVGKYVKDFSHEAIRASLYPYGNDKSVESFHDVRVNITTALTDILAFSMRQRMEIPIPLQGDLPVPGEAVSWSDDALPVKTDYKIRARSIRYDFQGGEAMITGEEVLDSSGLPVPAGLIVPFNSAGEVPSGWQKYLPPKNKFVVGHGSDHSAGDPGGSEELEFSSSTDGNHWGDQYNNFTDPCT